MGKFKKAVVGKDTTKTALDEMTSSISPELIEKWTAAERNAMIHWGQALRIYDVQIDKGQ